MYPAAVVSRWPPVVSAVGPVLLWLWMVGVTSQRIFREDRLALLSGTLRTFQVASCDGERLRLQCPAGTTVSIQLVQYGRLASKPGLCGSPADMRRFNYTECMDRSALKVVIDACGGKRQCQLHTSPALFGVDPCPGISKFVEVLYKCRPTEFRTKVVCQGQRRSIYCDQHRVAIYSASFGTRREGSVHCPQPPGVRLTDCQASFTSEKMISQCQGKPSCELSADPELFSRACPPDHNMYLTTKYTCVPREILREQYATEVDEDYQQNMTEAPSAELEEPVEPSEMEARDVPPVDENGQERLILYLTLGITVFLLLCLGVLVGRLCFRRKVKDARSEPPPPGFATDLVRPDSDLDLGLGRGVLGAGRLTPPHAGQTSFGAPPPAVGDRSRYQVPGRERGRLSPHQSGPGDSLCSREVNFGGSLRSREANFGDSLHSREANFGDSLRSREVNFGDNLLTREPAPSDSLRSREVKFSDSLRGRDAGYGNSLQSRDTGYGDSLRGREADFGSSMRSPAPSASLERMESSFGESLRSYGPRSGSPHSPCRTGPNAFYFS